MEPKVVFVKSSLYEYGPIWNRGFEERFSSVRAVGLLIKDRKWPFLHRVKQKLLDESQQINTADNVIKPSFCTEFCLGR